METPAETIQKVRESNQFKDLLSLAAKENDPLAAKLKIVAKLTPFFDNQLKLNRFAVEALLPEVITLEHLETSAIYYPQFLTILETYRRAKRTDPQSFYQALGFWFRPCEQALVKYWSVYHLEVEKSDLPLDEYVHESFRNIGDIVEALTQPFLRVLLHIVRIRDRMVPDANEIVALDLGIVIDKLIDECNPPELLLLAPWNIKLNQCRNIAFHHSVQVTGSDIVCTYGKPPHTKSFTTTRKEIFIATQNIFKVFQIVKLAYSLSAMDNISELRYPDDDPPVIRKESVLVNLVLQFASQGFDIVSFSDDSAISRIRVRDLMKRDDKKRAAHSSQFLFSLWEATQSQKVAVEYESADGILMYRFALDSTTCREMALGEKDPLVLQAEKMTINEID